MYWLEISQSGGQWPLLQTNQAALGFIVGNLKPAVLKHKTIFCLLTQSQRAMTPWMENICVSQLDLLLSFSLHG